MENTSAYVSFYVLSSNISQKTQANIIKTLSRYSNCSVEFITIDKHLFAQFPEKYHYSLAMYNRYLIPALKPELKKAIYSDVDVVFLNDIEEFYNIDLENKGLAAPIEELGQVLGGVWNHQYHKELLGLPETHKMFQSGNLLIDCEYWRKNNIIEKLLEITKQNKDKFITPDLDALNIVFCNNYKKLDYRYSVGTHFMENANCRIAPIIEGEQNPYLIHYAGSHKPWKRKTQCDEYFWQYASKTSFYQNLLLKRHLLGLVYFITNIFNLRNEYTQEGQKYKIITVLGIKLKFSVKKMG